MFEKNNESMVKSEERLLLITKARWIVILLLSAYGFITAYCYLFYFHLSFPQYFKIIKFPLTFVGIMVIYNSIYHWSCLKIHDFLENHLSFLIKTQLIIDILMATALIYLTGGIVSRFWGLYILLTLELTYIFPSYLEVIIFGALSSIMYTMIVGFEYFQIIPYVNPFAHTGLVNSKLHLNLTYSFTGWFWVNAANLSTVFLSSLLHGKEKSTVKDKIIRDSLTGLYNRKYFNHELNSEIAKAKRYNHIISLLMIDIDNFKEFNNCFGKKEGDKLLKSISNILKTNLRGGDNSHSYDIDVISRFGGEEFAVILHDISTEKTLETVNRLMAQVEMNVNNAFITAERLRNAVKETSNTCKSEITISIGVASFPFHAKTADDLIDKANEALVKAKRKGKNTTVISLPFKNLAKTTS